ncbi:hypothetical protein EV679_0326 [Kerstersia gyiorum]|uniref:Uncharacterized protein n=1 Tax=Kerstersia gyiorum TaxID=206506 RepID=A0A4Q7MVU9_9BURK|nr:hypothetical protein EV679_0326 [Kerstersia gyiorum]
MADPAKDALRQNFCVVFYRYSLIALTPGREKMVKDPGTLNRLINIKGLHQKIF